MHSYLYTIGYYENLNFMYSVCAGLGLFAAVIATAIKFRLKHIPIFDLIHSLYFLMPSALLGASFFGKIGVSKETDLKIWEYFFFWNPGMSFFGGLFFGLIAGFIFFSHRSKRRLISIFVYADCIAPNILLGQSIGRWGNLFNHEILGKPIGVDKINWLPGWIWHRLFYYINPEDGSSYASITYREPLFLYESMATLLLWILLTFIIPNLGRFFSKKPWKIDEINFPCKFNKIYKTLPQENIPYYNLQFPIVYKTSKKNNELYLSIWNVWNKAYYYYEPDKEVLAASITNIKNLDNEFSKNFKRYQKVSSDIKNIKSLMKTSKGKNIIGESPLVENYFDKKKQLVFEKKELRKKISRINYWRNVSSRELTRVHNPNNYFIIRSGLISSLYLAFYSIIRMSLEYHRDKYEMFIKWDITTNYVLFLIFFILGISLAILSQFVFPNKFRRKDWLYEKSY